MNLSQHLLVLARNMVEQLARAGRPNPAVLRRAVSTAYYAVFHLLVERATDCIVGVTADSNFRSIVSRSFEHSHMKELSAGFASGNPPPKVRTALGTNTIPPALAAVAQTFNDLQDARHMADYDTMSTYSKSDALEFVIDAEEAFTNLAAVIEQPATRIFLTLLPVWEAIKKRK